METKDFPTSFIPPEDNIASTVTHDLAQILKSSNNCDAMQNMYKLDVRIVTSFQGQPQLTIDTVQIYPGPTESSNATRTRRDPNSKRIHSSSA